MTHPMDGMRVLDLTRLLPGGVCTMMLGDLGADVVKIEDPVAGDYSRWLGPQIKGQGVFFRMNNRGKRSIILNLKDERGQAVLKKLVETADVLVEGFRPGVMARLGCDYDALKAVNSKLVYCSLSGWGADGPYAQMGNHDLNYVSVAGMTGAMEMSQVMGGQIADIGGAYIAVSGILAALLRRERTGEGAYIDTGLSEAALPFSLYNWVEAQALGLDGEVGGLSGGQACYRVYQSSDGRALALGALEEKFWTNFCNAVKRPDLIEGYTDPGRQEYLITEVSGIFGMKTADEWREHLADVDCCFTVANQPGEISDDPHYQARGMLGHFEDGTPWMRSPVRLSESDPQPMNHIPGYGEHTEVILKDAGYSKEELATLKDESVIR
jgi:alpha-methylacyl-CoA racemase